MGCAELVKSKGAHAAGGLALDYGDADLAKDTELVIRLDEPPHRGRREIVFHPGTINQYAGGLVLLEQVNSPFSL